MFGFPLEFPTHSLSPPPAINFKGGRNRGGGVGSLLCVYYERFNANSKAQSGKPKGILKDEFCIPMFCVRTAPSALCWCGKVMFDRRRDQWVNACVRFHAYTIRRRGRATCSVDQYTHGRRLGRNEAQTGFECSQEARALDKEFTITSTQPPARPLRGRERGGFY